MIHVDQQQCIGCESCIPTCPLRDFYLDDEGKAALVGPDKFVCIACGHCVSVCPTDAITMDGDGSVPRPEAPATLEEGLAWTMRTRRSIRSFKPEPLPKQIVAELLDTARYAPTAKNMQEITWTAVDDPAILKSVGDLTAAWLLKHPASEHVGKAYFAGQDRVLRGAPMLVMCGAPESNPLSPQDCATALAYMELLLHVRGLGSCWAGYVTNAAAVVPELRAVFGVPEGRRLYGGLMIGNSLERFLRIPGRKPAQLTWL